MSSPPPKRRSGTALLIVLALLVVGGIVVDQAFPPQVAGAPAPVEQPPARAGTWYCPVTTGPQGVATLSVAAVGSEPSVVTVVRYPPGRLPPDAPPSDVGMTEDPPVAISPGDQYDLVLEPGQGNRPIAVRWQGGPAVAAWRLEASDPGSAPCAEAPSSMWYVTGFQTTLGSSAQLHLFNPFGEDAVARLVFGTDGGRDAPVRTDALSVPPRSSRVVDLSEFEPERTDLGVVIEVRAGRLIAQGELTIVPPGNTGGVRGRVLLAASKLPTLDWAFGFSRDDPGSSSWLAVFNPADRGAAVEVRVSDPGVDSDLLVGEQSVPPGGMLRIPLASASAAQEYGVAVSSVNDIGIVVTRVTSLSNTSGAGLAASAGQVPTTQWALVGGGTQGRRSRVSVYNPGTEPVSVDVTVPGGPPEWAGIMIGPNGRVGVELGDAAPDRSAVAARVSASGPVVAELRVLGPGGGLGLWTATGVPELSWAGAPLRLPVRRDSGLDTRGVPLPGT